MSAVDKVNPNQLKMFMTAREITDQYKPHNGDRQVVETGKPVHDSMVGRRDPREGEYTNREIRTDGMINRPARPESTEREGRTHYRPFNELIRALPGGQTAETDDQLWHRKATEARVGSLGQSLLADGVKAPISLSPDQGTVVGGHHRVGFMAEEKPDTLLPVTHHKSIFDAKYEAPDEYGHRKPRQSYT